MFKLLIPGLEFEKLCVVRGETPLPPYIHSGLNENELREKYQTLFAANPASVAAPTGSLHFTPRVFESLAEKGIVRASVTLHVGRGTFSPVDDAAIEGGVLHPEPIILSREAAETISGAKKPWRGLYDLAIRERFRFYSFGDSMLII